MDRCEQLIVLRDTRWMVVADAPSFQTRRWRKPERFECWVERFDVTDVKTCRQSETSSFSSGVSTP